MLGSAGTWGLQSANLLDALAGLRGLSYEPPLPSPPNPRPGALEHAVNRCGSQAQLSLSTWDLPALGIKLASSALAGEFFSH